MSAYDVDLTTGVLSYDDSVPPYALKSELINRNLDLLVDGWGLYTLSNGNVLVNDNPFLQPDRELRATGTIRTTDGHTVGLNSQDIVSFKSDFDAGELFPVGLAPSCAYTLVLSNTNREWDFGGDYLRGHSLDGALVNIQIGAKGHTDFEYASFGWFIVEKVNNKSNQNIVLSGSDFMANRMSRVYSGRYYPIDMWEILLSACERANVEMDEDSLTRLMEIGGSITTAPVFDTPPTCRDIVKWISQITYRNAFINRDGKLALAPFGYLDAHVYMGNTTRSLTEDIYKTITINVPAKPMNFALTINDWAGTDGPWLHTYYIIYENSNYYQFEIQGNPFLDYTAPRVEITSQIFDVVAVSGVVNATSMSVNWVGDNVIRPFDLVTVYHKNNAYYFPVFQQSFEYSGGLNATTGFNISTAALSEAELVVPKYYA